MRLRARRHRRNLRPPEGLRITSMMDILTVLLLFLLKSFVAEGDGNGECAPEPGVGPAQQRLAVGGRDGVDGEGHGVLPQP